MMAPLTASVNTGWLRAAGRTDPGRVRAVNEDAFLIDPEIGLLIVADGMGGAQAGEVASALAVQGVRRHIGAGKANAATPEALETLVRDALQAANGEICERAARDPALDGMGTTAVLALCCPAGVLVAHVGDSRAYLIRENEIYRLTEDHTFVAQLVRAGKISEKQAAEHQLRNLITRNLGNPESARPDLRRLAWANGDRLLLCSDGLSKAVSEKDIQKTVTRHGADLETACAKLIELALRNGGTDNITLILACHSPL